MGDDGDAGAQKRGSPSAPGICAANSAGKAPYTTEAWAPIFSNSRPRSIAMRPPPPGAPLASVRSQGSIVKRPGGSFASAPANSRSSASVASMIRRWMVSNQSRDGGETSIARFWRRNVHRAAVAANPRDEPLDVVDGRLGQDAVAEIEDMRRGP